MSKLTEAAADLEKEFEERGRKPISPNNPNLYLNDQEEIVCDKHPNATPQVRCPACTGSKGGKKRTAAQARARRKNAGHAHLVGNVALRKGAKNRYMRRCICQDEGWTLDTILMHIKQAAGARVTRKQLQQMGEDIVERFEAEMRARKSKAIWDPKTGKVVAHHTEAMTRQELEIVRNQVIEQIWLESGIDLFKAEDSQ